MEFKPFDARHYPTLAVSEGYAEWARSYDAVVKDEMDLRLLARLGEIEWAAAGRGSISPAAPGGSVSGCGRRAWACSTGWTSRPRCWRRRGPAASMTACWRATCAQPAFPTRATIL